MKTDGSGERILTEGFHNEGPTWAPNGLFLMFFRDSGGQGGAENLHDGRVRPLPNFRCRRRDMAQRSRLGPAAGLRMAFHPLVANATDDKSPKAMFAGSY